VTDNMKPVIEWQLEKLNGLLEEGSALPIEELRHEAAELQVVLAEAARLERINAAEAEAELLNAK
jgi:hypothetical protein